MSRRRPPARSQLLTGTLVNPDPQTQSRMFSELAEAVERARSQQVSRTVHVLDLPVGATRINHGLGRKARGATVTPTTADATWAWAFSVDGDAVAIITTIGVTQMAATVEVF